MTRYKDEEHALSRRGFLKSMRWAPVLFVPAPLQASSLRLALGENPGDRAASFHFADLRFTPHYPAKSPLDEILRS